MTSLFWKLAPSAKLLPRLIATPPAGTICSWSAARKLLVRRQEAPGPWPGRTPPSRTSGQASQPPTRRPQRCPPRLAAPASSGVIFCTPATPTRPIGTTRDAPCPSGCDHERYEKLSGVIALHRSDLRLPRSLILKNGIFHNPPRVGANLHDISDRLAPYAHNYQANRITKRTGLLARTVRGVNPMFAEQLRAGGHWTTGRESLASAKKYSPPEPPPAAAIRTGTSAAGAMAFYRIYVTYVK
jgi:hypothetical protein